MGIEGRYITTNSHGEAESHADDEHHHHPEKMRRVDHHAACLLYEPAEEAVEAVQELGLGSDPSVHTDASDSNHKKLYLLPPLPLVEDDSSSISDNNTIDPKDSSINPHCNPTSDDKSDPNHSANSKTSTIRRVLDLLKTFTPGSDLTRLQVPVQLNMPKSQLQMYGESVYCCRNDLLGNCARGSTTLQRFLNVVAWHISTTRLAPFSQAPFNPILGETHHVSCGNLNVILEQVSHHPPITALYATNEVDNLRLQWWHNACPRFYGNKVEVAIHGKRNLWLDSHKESYEMTSPKLCIRLFPIPGNEWVGNTIVKCNTSGYEATLTFKPKPFMGLRGDLGHLSGQIWDRARNQLLYELNGQWNKVMMLKDIKTKKTSVLFDAQDCLTKLKAPIVRDIKGVKTTESLMVWRSVMEGLMKKDWELARKAKNEIEDKQREQKRLRNKAQLVWTPKYFELKDNQWQWRHSFGTVSQAPLMIPSM